MELDKVNIFDYQAPSPEDILAAGPGAIAAPLSPAELMEIEKSQLSSDPVIRKLQKVGRGIGSLFEVETPLDYALSGLGAAKPVVAAGKGIAAVAKEADPKDLVFVHNTNEEAIKSFDNIGGIPSPSIAVTKADKTFTGFGKIQLIGKPEKFDPLVDPRNKIYSADAYTPRAPKPLRLAKPGADKQIAKDYANIKINYGNAEEILEQGEYALRNLQKDNIYYPENRIDELERFFYSPLAKRKYAKEKGLGDEVFDQYDGFKDYSINQDFIKWSKKEKDKYLSRDAIFQYFDEFEETTKTMPYTLDNIVENMIQETQRGGESGLGMMGANRLRALMSERFESLPDIKKRKEMIDSLSDDHSATFFDIDERIINALGKISYEATDYYEHVLDAVGANLKSGSTLDKAVEDAFKTGHLSRVDEIAKSPKIEEVMEDVATTLRLNAMRPVQYFEAKPTRAVGFDEFAGAIVPDDTSKEVIDILEKRGLKVLKESDDDIENYAFDAGEKARNLRQKHFKDQFFSAAPIAAAASATAMIDSQDQGIGSL